MLDDSCVASCRVGKTYQSCQPAGAIFFGKARIIQGGFFHWYPPKKLKYGKLRLGESTLTYTSNLA